MKRPDDLQMWLFEPSSTPHPSESSLSESSIGATAVVPSSAQPRRLAAPSSQAHGKARVDVPLMLRLRLDTADMETPEEFFHRLDGFMEGSLERLILTDNRTSILNARPEAGRGLQVRLHWSFAGASDALLSQVAAFAEGRLRGAERRQTLTALREHFRAHGSALPAPGTAGAPTVPGARTRRPRLRPVGDCFDLRQLRDTVNEQYFDGRLFVHITWGKVPMRRRTERRRRAPVRRTIHLGTYTPELNLVRIHRKLDQPWVPRYVVESVVYHEMLHADIPALEKNGRRRLHTPEFRRRERLFERFEDAEQWLRAHLPRLLD